MFLNEWMDNLQPYNFSIKDIEENLFLYFMHIGWCSDGIVHNATDEKWVYTKTNLFNTVFHLNHSIDCIELSLYKTLELFKLWNTPVTFMICAEDKRSHVVEKALVDLGLKKDEVLVGMMLDLKDLPQRTRPSPLLTIEEIKTLNSFNLWIETLISGFEIDVEKRETFKYLFKKMGISSQKPWRHFLAYLDNPVATCTLFNGGGITGLYWVSTIPTERKKGISTKLIWSVLKESFNEDHRIIVLQATTAGKKVYAKLGFKEYSKILTYRWQP